MPPSYPSLHSARRYIRLIKHELGPTSPRYRAFLNLLRVHASTAPHSASKDSRELIERVRELLNGHEALLEGFRAYLPEGYDDPLEEERPNKRRHHRAPLLAWTEDEEPEKEVEDVLERNHYEYTTCKLCKGHRNAVAIKRNEPILLCETKGCNREYHLKCLPRGLVDSSYEGDDSDMFVYKENEEEPAELMGDYHIPSGEIYCRACSEEGSTTVLRQYFERCDNLRSNFSSSRGYVMNLLERHMRENIAGNALKEGDNLDAEEEVVQLKPPPRSELWYVEEMNRMALRDTDGSGGGINGKSPRSKDAWSSAEFLIGKPLRLYCNLDNEYHNGRIVDWRTCSVYPHNNEGMQKLKSDSKHRSHISDLDYYGTGAISSCEFLVRFPAGDQGRKKELMQWMLLEEHSLAVGISLVRGQYGSEKYEKWKPAMVLARSALELVPVRQFLHEGPRGELFDKMERDGKTHAVKKAGDFWALTSFFGGNDYAVLNLRGEVRGLITRELVEERGLSVDSSDEDKSEQSPSKYEKSTLEDQSSSKDDESSPTTAESAPTEVTEEKTTEESDKPTDKPIDKPPPVKKKEKAIPIKLGLALMEYNEQRQCSEWYKSISRDQSHPFPLASAEELATETKGDADGNRDANAMQLEENDAASAKQSKDVFSIESKTGESAPDAWPQQSATEDAVMVDSDAANAESKGEDKDLANTNDKERTHSFDDHDDVEDDESSLGDEIEEEYDEGIYGDYDVVESYEDESDSLDGLMSVDSSQSYSSGYDTMDSGVSSNRGKIGSKRARPRQVDGPGYRKVARTDSSDSDPVVGLSRGQTVINGRKVTVDVVRTGGRGRPRHVSVTPGKDYDSPKEEVKRPPPQSRPTPQSKPAPAAVTRRPSVEVKKPPPKSKALAPKPKPVPKPKPPPKVLPPDSSSESEGEAPPMSELPRGITMRPSGKWQAQLYYAGKSRYLGVFKNRQLACKAYEIARLYLLDEKAKNATLPNDINMFISNARKMANDGVMKKKDKTVAKSVESEVVDI